MNISKKLCKKLGLIKRIELNRNGFIVLSELIELILKVDDYFIWLNFINVLIEYIEYDLLIFNSYYRMIIKLIIEIFNVFKLFYIVGIFFVIFIVIGKNFII